MTISRWFTRRISPITTPCEVDLNPVELHSLVSFVLANKQYGVDRIVITHRSDRPRVVTATLLDTRGEVVAENEISDPNSW